MLDDEVVVHPSEVVAYAQGDRIGVLACVSRAGVQACVSLAKRVENAEKALTSVGHAYPRWRDAAKWSQFPNCDCDQAPLVRLDWVENIFRGVYRKIKCISGSFIYIHVAEVDVINEVTPTNWYRQRYLDRTGALPSEVAVSDGTGSLYEDEIVLFPSEVIGNPDPSYIGILICASRPGRGPRLLRRHRVQNALIAAGCPDWAMPDGKALRGELSPDEEALRGEKRGRSPTPSFRTWGPCAPPFRTDDYAGAPPFRGADSADAAGLADSADAAGSADSADAAGSALLATGSIGQHFTENYPMIAGGPPPAVGPIAASPIFTEADPMIVGGAPPAEAGTEPDDASMETEVATAEADPTSIGLHLAHPPESACTEVDSQESFSDVTAWR